jgi:hypothetical protein
MGEVSQDLLDQSPMVNTIPFLIDSAGSVIISINNKG